MRKIYLVILAVLCCIPGKAAGRDDMPNTVSNSFMLNVGAARRADTYLTPLHYRGWASQLAYEHINAAVRHPFLWVLNADVEIDRTLNNVRNSAMLGAQFQARWAMMNRWRIARPFEVGVGGATTLDAGALYLSRNGNNPVAANASWTLDLSAYATARFCFGRVKAVAFYRATLPVVGAMFTPDYGQLYYEIYLGDRHSIFGPAFWGRYFRLDQRLTVDLKVGPKWLRVGYGVDIMSSKVNDIVSRRINHVFVLGLTTDWISGLK